MAASGLRTESFEGEGAMRAHATISKNVDGQRVLGIETVASMQDSEKAATLL